MQAERLVSRSGVPVYGLGQYADGRPYYVMRFIRGDSLKEAVEAFHAAQSSRHAPRDEPPGWHAEQQPHSSIGESVIRKAHHAERDGYPSRSDEPPTNPTASQVTNLKSQIPNGAPDFTGLAFRQLLGRFIDVCHAISYAHSRGVLHRDLKPGNIMLGQYGETLVVDWGLARLQDRAEPAQHAEHTLKPPSGSGVTPTMMGSAVGTPAYMSPEQAAGRLDELGPATDVYSLGATLFHLLTGQPPFRGSDHGAVLRDVQAGKIPRPTSLQPSIPRSLEAVCLKSMSLRPSDRYVSPQHLADEIERFLADEIERFLADEPVTAATEPFAVRARRWVRKHPTMTSAPQTPANAPPAPRLRPLRKKPRPPGNWLRQTKSPHANRASSPSRP